MNPLESTSGQPVDSFATISNVPIRPETDRVNPNQVASGLTRGATVTVGADGYPQVLQGSQKTFGNGFYVAKPGHDVITETSASNLIFNSNQNVFKVVATGTTKVTIPSGYGAGEYNSLINHSLNSYPVVVSYVTPPYVTAADKYVLDNPNLSAVGGVVKWQTYTTTGLTYVTFSVDLQAALLTGVVGDWLFTYYLLQETAG
jgi:hypothetical protein